jgi:tRNA-Thr(GGU) m(6)t(6)A37 methyltransferase TsaA
MRPRVSEPISLQPLHPIGVIRSPWKEKFGIPRQSGLARDVESIVELDRERIPAEALRGLEGVSHVWLLCWFHASADEGWRATVRPPRLGGAQRLGVFATRSPHRPNPISLSLVRICRGPSSPSMRAASGPMRGPSRSRSASTPGRKPRSPRTPSPSCCGA